MNKCCLILSPVFLSDIGGIEMHIKMLVEMGLVSNVIVFRDGKYWDASCGSRVSTRKLIALVSNVDFIWSHCPRIPLRFRLLSLRKRTVYSSHGYIFHNSKSFFRRAYIYMKLWVVKLFFMRVISVSKSDYGAMPSHLSVLVENPCRFDIPDILNQRRCVDFCFIGRVTEHKRLDKFLWFIEVYFPDCKAVVATSSPDLSLPKSVELRECPSNDDVCELLKSCKFLVSFSDYEGFGLTVVEAASLGCVPILSENEAFTAHRKAGLSAFGVESVSEIKRLLKDDEALHAVALHNLPFARKFSKRSFLQKIANLVE